MRGYIDLGFCRRLESHLLDIARDPDDRDPGRAGRAELDPFAERILIRPKLPRHGFADDGDPRRLGAVPFLDPLANRNSHRRQIAGSELPVQRVAARPPRNAFDLKAPRASLSVIGRNVTYPAETTPGIFPTRSST